MYVWVENNGMSVCLEGGVADKEGMSRAIKNKMKQTNHLNERSKFRQMYDMPAPSSPKAHLSIILPLSDTNCVFTHHIFFAFIFYFDILL